MTISCSYGFTQVVICFNRHNMNYWNYICAVLLLASAGEIFSSIFAIRFDKPFND